MESEKDSRFGGLGGAAGRTEFGMRIYMIHPSTLLKCDMDEVMQYFFFIPETDGYIPVLKHLNKIHKMLALLVHSFVFSLMLMLLLLSIYKHDGGK